MKDQNLTREQLLEEVTKLRQEISEMKLTPQGQNYIHKISESSITNQRFSSGSAELLFSIPPEQPNHSGKLRFSDLVDVPLLRKLSKSFYAATGIPNSIVDVDGIILSGLGWQDICTRFHRVCPETECRCRESDSYIAAHLDKGAYVGYKCLNGLMDYAVPIIIEGQHLATFFHGQFLHEKPDLEFYRKQAQKYGFDETAYLEALQRVPVIPADQVGSIMEFFSQFAFFLAETGLERKRQLDSAEQKFLKAFQCNPDLMTISTLKEGRYVEVNDACVAITNYHRHELIGHTSQELGIWVVPEERENLIKQLQEYGSIREYELKLRSKSGEIRTFCLSGEIIMLDDIPHLLNTCRDITERKQMEIEMKRLDRLNMVGEMAASIGHEIRNPMTAVRGYLQILKENEHRQQELDYFELMIEELDRANLIITEFLSLAKNKMLELNPGSINAIISKLWPLIQAKTMSRDQYIKMDLGELPDFMLDKKEIPQLILNLINNSLEAMPPGGEVTVRTYLEGVNVVLMVQDQGHGIDPDLLDKLGTPFFSTKEQGTGLGLAVCYRIAARHKAKIDIDTSSSGTTFFVRFPIPNDANVEC